MSSDANFAALGRQNRETETIHLLPLFGTVQILNVDMQQTLQKI
jgi:hypothetical protein